MNSLWTWLGRWACVAWMFLGLMACSAGGDRSEMIPANATAVLTLDMGKLGTKALSVSDLWTFWVNDTSNPNLAFAQRLQHAGIDWRESVHAFVSNEGLQVLVGVIAPLNNAVAFEAALTDFLQSRGRKISVKEQKGIRYVQAGEEIGLVLWEHETAIWLQQSGWMFSEKDLLRQGSDLFELSPRKQLVHKSESFASLLQQSKDISLYFDDEKVAPLIMMMNPLLATSGVADLEVSLGLDFELGEIEWDFAARFGKKDQVWINMLEKKFDPLLLAGIFSANPISLVTLSTDPNQAQDLLEALDFFEGTEGESGHGKKDRQALFHALKGDVAVVMNHWSIGSDELHEEPITDMDEPKAGVMVAAGINDRNVIQHMLAGLVDAGGLQQAGDAYFAPPGKWSFFLDTNRLLMANDPRMIEAFLQGGLRDLPDPIGERARHHAATGFVDLAQMEPLFQARFQRNTSDKSPSTGRAFPVERGEWSLDAYDSQSLTGNGSILTVDSRENALRTILAFLSGWKWDKDRWGEEVFP